MAIKITQFEAENVKRVKAVAMEPTQSGLTVIGGRNGQGKTSVLDAIAWALGGNKNKPTEARREGAATDPRLKVTLSNGIVVERKGANGTLKVIDPEGRKSGQALLDGFVEQLALDLPKFMNASGKEKAETLLTIIGVGEQLAALDQEHDRLYNQRLAIGQMERQKRGAAEEMAFYPEAPEEPVSAADLIKRQQAILGRNGENQRMRDNAAALAREADQAKQREEDARRNLENLERQLASARERCTAAVVEAEEARKAAATASKSAEALRDESTAEIEADIASIEAVNAKVRTNYAKHAATEEADGLKDQYDELSDAIDAVRRQRADLLNGAKLPLDGLSVIEGQLTYKGQRWDCMSGSEQLRVATAIVRAIKPECGFVLVDKLEQMDAETLAEFGAWAEAEGLQIIGTRVSTGGECSIVIEDGRGSTDEQPARAEASVDWPAQPNQAWSI